MFCQQQLLLRFLNAATIKTQLKLKESDCLMQGAMESVLDFIRLEDFRVSLT